MAKCIRCSRGGMGVLHQAVKLKDKNYVCFKCYKELGGQPMKDLTTAPLLYTYEDIKDGFDAMYERARKEKIAEAVRESVSVRMVGGGHGYDLDCTEEEREIFDIIRSRCDDVDLDPSVLQLVRKSKEYVSVIMQSSNGDQLDLARLKFTDRAKWIRFAPNFDKVQLEDTEDVAKISGAIFSAYRFNEPYL